MLANKEHEERNGPYLITHMYTARVCKIHNCEWGLWKNECKIKSVFRKIEPLILNEQEKRIIRKKFVFLLKNDLIYSNWKKIQEKIFRNKNFDVTDGLIQKGIVRVITIISLS